MGRPRSFDADEALDAAMRLFWRTGYDGTSLADLTDAMGINRRSLYATFGNKEDLFHLVVRRYEEGPGRFFAEAVGQPTGRGTAEYLLHAAADSFTDPGLPSGCFLVQGGPACDPDGPPAAYATLAEHRRISTEMLRERLERARAEGDLPADADPAFLATYLSTVLQGLSIQASSGTPRAELHRLADFALASWPS
ncbi:TetR/AcrR family transcriptional regulator [Actinocorallia longicatena]|uniref:TetR/AcrR family transcriptional regulator n=1 Tax=Actinocorallia longicatena TaxID=111803 RepID=A0ABP6QA30_9ACTN